MPGMFCEAMVTMNSGKDMPIAAARVNSGITQTGTYIGAVSGPLLFGVIAQSTSYRAAWLVAAAFAVLGAATMTAGRRALRAWRATAEPVPL